MGTYFVVGIGVVGDIGVQGNFVGGMRGRILDWQGTGDVLEDGKGLDGGVGTRDRVDKALGTYCHQDLKIYPWYHRLFCIGSDKVREVGEDSSIAPFVCFVQEYVGSRGLHQYLNQRRVIQKQCYCWCWHRWWTVCLGQDWLQRLMRRLAPLLEILFFMKKINFELHFEKVTYEHETKLR